MCVFAKNQVDESNFTWEKVMLKLTFSKFLSRGKLQPTTKVFNFNRFQVFWISQKHFLTSCDINTPQ